mgnify:CR=1 FL=1
MVVGIGAKVKMAYVTPFLMKKIHQVRQRSVLRGE